MANFINVYCESAEPMDVIARVVFPFEARIIGGVLISDALFHNEDPLAFRISVVADKLTLVERELNFYPPRTTITTSFVAKAGAQLQLQTYDAIGKLWMAIAYEDTVSGTHQLQYRPDKGYTQRGITEF